MLTDPPTSPGKESDQVRMGALAGLVAAAAQLAGAGQVYLLLGLLAVNVALTLQRWLADRRRPLAGGGSAVDLSRGTGQSRVPLAA
jgi:hypothetical protein